jgi:hypothetical protein
MRIEVFWDITPCTLVNMYRRLAAACFLRRWEFCSSLCCADIAKCVGALSYVQLRAVFELSLRHGFTLGHRPAVSPVCLFCTTTAASLLVGTNEQMLVDTPLLHF